MILAEPIATYVTYRESLASELFRSCSPYRYSLVNLTASFTGSLKKLIIYMCVAFVEDQRAEGREGSVVFQSKYYYFLLELSTQAQCHVTLLHLQQHPSTREAKIVKGKAVTESMLELPKQHSVQ